MCINVCVYICIYTYMCEELKLICAAQVLLGMTVSSFLSVSIFLPTCAAQVLPGMARLRINGMRCRRPRCQERKQRVSGGEGEEKGRGRGRARRRRGTGMGESLMKRRRSVFIIPECI